LIQIKLRSQPLLIKMAIAAVCGVVIAGAVWVIAQVASQV
jgi:hypothetical protein